MNQRLKIVRVPKPVVTTWLRELRNPNYPALPEGHFVSIQQSTCIDGELSELFLYHSPDGNCYITVNPEQ